jgi:hypothetical protein
MTILRLRILAWFWWAAFEAARLIRRPFEWDVRRWHTRLYLFCAGESLAVDHYLEEATR